MRKIIHVDMDAFFASIEQRERPHLRGKPVLVGGSPRRRGVICTCSYEARVFGIHSGMSSALALRKCPFATLIEPNGNLYHEVSNIIHGIFYKYTNLVESVSVDEAYLDVTKNHLNISSATQIALEIKKEIWKATNLTASAGVSYNKFLAKVASDYNKPNGLTVITPNEAQKFLDTLPIRKFHGLGKVSSEKLLSLNIKTGNDLKKISRENLRMMFGKTGDFFYDIVRGIDERPVELPGDPKSISRETTLYEDCIDKQKIRLAIRSLAGKVALKTKESGFFARSIFIKVKYSDFQTITRSIKLSKLDNSVEYLGSMAVKLVNETEIGRRFVRLVGVGLGNLEPIDAPRFEQPELPNIDSMK